MIYHDRAGLVFGSAAWDAAVKSGESVMNSALAAYVRFPGHQNWEGSTAFRPRRRMSSYVLLERGVQVPYLFPPEPNTPPF